jgi:hypothetical protein
MPCRGELIGTRPFLEERATEDNHTQREYDEDDKVNQMHNS